MLASDATASVHKDYLVFYKRYLVFHTKGLINEILYPEATDPWHLGWTVVSALHTEGV